MVSIVRLYRIIAICLWLVFLALLTVPYRFGNRDRTKRIIYIAHLWTKGIAKIINLKIKVHGKPYETREGLVISNHWGYLDIVTHGATFLLRHSPNSEIREWPILGWVAGLCRPIWIDRKTPHAAKKTLENFIETMRAGMYPLVYPEGTSSDGKGDLLPFKSTPFEALVQADLPALPILTRYREKPARELVAWYGGMTFFPHMWKLLGEGSTEAELYLLPPIYPEGRSRKEMAVYVHNIMNSEYKKIKNRG